MNTRQLLTRVRTVCFLVISLVAAVWVGCGQETKIKDGVFLIEDAVAATALVETEQISFPRDQSSQLAERRVGDIIVSGYETGFLRRIKSINTGQQRLIFTTEQVVLTDAIENSSTGLMVNPGATESAGEVASKQSYLVNEGPSISANIINRRIYQDIALGGSLELTKAALSFNPSLDLGLMIEGANLKSFRAVAEGDLHVEVAAKITGKIAVEQEQTIWEGKSKTYRLQAGWFPIVVTVKPKLLAKLSGSTDVGSIEFGASGKLSVKMGMQFIDGHWQPVAEKQSGVQLMAPVTESGKSSEISLSVYPQLEVKLYGLEGPYINVQPYVSLKQTADMLIYKTEVKLALQGNVGGELKIFKKVYANVELTLFDLILVSKDFRQDQSCSGAAVQPCGMCGTQKRTCTAGAWSAWGSCTEGMCSSPCSGKRNGLYCGHTLAGYVGISTDLVTCASNNVSDKRPCSDGCQVNQPAADDVCKPMACTTYYSDADGDNYGDRSLPGRCQSGPSGSYTALVNIDCNDADRDIHPGHTEWWDLKDNDCNGQTDEAGLVGYDRWHKEWSATDWEHRFALAVPGIGWSKEPSGRSVRLYPTDVCSGTYRSPSCVLLGGGAYAEVRSGVRLPALGECGGQYAGGSHITLYLLEDSTEYRDYSLKAGFSCRRFGYVLPSSALPMIPGAKGFHRLRSTFVPPGRSDNLWSSEKSEAGHTDYSTAYAEDTNHWVAPGGY